MYIDIFHQQNFFIRQIGLVLVAMNRGKFSTIRDLVLIKYEK
jgi:hypothetical protein